MWEEKLSDIKFCSSVYIVVVGGKVSPPFLLNVEPANYSREIFPRQPATRPGLLQYLL